MKKTDKLYELIRSMTMSEKRYFTLFAGRHTIGEQNNYIALFEVLESLPVYDPQKVAEKLDRAGLPVRHLASDKNYLYNLILKGLSAFYAGKTITQKIKELLHQVEILYERGMYDQGLELIAKARDLAQKYELFPLLIEISHWERKALTFRGDTGQLARAHTEVLGYMAQMDNLHAFIHLHNQMKELQQQLQRARSPEDVTRLRQFIAHPFLASEEIALTFQARILYWHIMGLYHYTLGDTARECEVQETLIQHMSSRPDYIQDFPLEYIVVYSRWLTLSLAAPEATFAEYIKVFRAFPQHLRRSRRDVAAQVETESALIHLERLRRMGLIADALAALAPLQEVLSRHDRHLSLRQRWTGHLLPALIQAAAGQPRLALPGLNTILNTYPEAQGTDLYAAARLLNLMVHTELGNASVVNYEATSWHRHLLQHQPYCRAEILLMDFFMRLTRDGRKHPLPLSAWMHTRDTLRQLQDDPLEALPAHAPDILAWLSINIDLKKQDSA